MKKFYLVIVALCLSIVAHGQLRPPVQSDTLVVQSVKYNYSDIRKENWPCNIIVKSTTSFQFGDQVINIKYAKEWGMILNLIARRLGFGWRITEN